MSFVARASLAGHFVPGSTRVQDSSGDLATGDVILSFASGAFDVAPITGAGKLRETERQGMLREWEPMTRDYRSGLVVVPVESAWHVGRYRRASAAPGGVPHDVGGPAAMSVATNVGTNIEGLDTDGE